MAGQQKAIGEVIAAAKQAISGILKEAPVMRNEREVNPLARSALSMYGETRDPRKAGYVFGDGTMLDLSEGGDYRSLSHGQVGRDMGLGGQSNLPPEVSFMEQAHAVRLDPDELTVESTRSPSNRQRGALMDILNHPDNSGYGMELEATDPTTMNFIGSQRLPDPSNAQIQGFYNNSMKRRAMSSFGQRVDAALQYMKENPGPDADRRVQELLMEAPADSGVLGGLFRNE